jgi:ferritin-like metal-binding protein YciE
MKDITNLNELLLHHLQNLYSAEDQQLKVLPSIIKRVNHRSLKNALKHHLELTVEHKNRIEIIFQSLAQKEDKNTAIGEYRGSNYTCKGMMGLVDEANELLDGKLTQDVTDAAIIACVQKMEHYEICTYGTAHAYALQLHEHKIEKLLKETLDEEYDADDLLTALATAALNKEAIPEGQAKEDEPVENSSDENIYTGTPSHKTTSSERTINSPGGRAGTSHRGYPGGESRGH